MVKHIFIRSSFLLIAALFAACTTGSAPPTGAPEQPTAGVANPASVYCLEQGGSVTILTRGDGGEYGVCLFEDNRQCEEWALLRGDCPPGGIKVTGYVTPAAVYCAIHGGEYTISGQSNTDQEQGSCGFKNGSACDAWEFYNGQCGPTP